MPRVCVSAHQADREGAALPRLRLDGDGAQVLRRFALNGGISAGRGAEALAEALLVTCDGRAARAHGHRAKVHVLV